MTNTEKRNAVVIAKTNLIRDELVELSCHQITEVLRTLGIWDENVYVTEWYDRCLEDAHNFALETYNNFSVSVEQGRDYFLFVQRSAFQHGECTVTGFHGEGEDYFRFVPVKYAAKKIVEKKLFDVLIPYLPEDVTEAMNNDPQGYATSFYKALKESANFSEEEIDEMMQTFSFVELLKLSVDDVMCCSKDYSPTGKWKWVAKSNDGSFQDESRCVFDTKEEAYNDMRSAALEKMKWNTEWADVIGGFGEDNDDFSLGYEVHFCPSWIEHTSYSGTYTYKIIQATSEDLLHMQRKPKISREEATMLISMYGFNRIWATFYGGKSNIEFELDGWSGETGLISKWIEEFISESCHFDFDKQSVYDYAEEFITEKMQFIAQNPDTAYREYRYR